jgi:hypothetical protein
MAPQIAPRRCSLPLAKEHIVDDEYIAVGPLLPLRLLMGNP